MRITIANVRGMGRVVNRRGSRRTDDGLHDNINATKPDICIFTETKLLPENDRPQEFYYLRRWWDQHKDQINIFQDTVTDQQKKKGVAIFIKPGLNFTINATRTSGRGRHVIINISLLAHTYNIAAFYGSDHSSDLISLEALNNMYHDLKQIQQQHPGETIIAGDFNFVMNKDDATTNIANKPLTAARMEQIMIEQKIEDAWLHIKNPEDSNKGHTYVNQSTQKTSRLDRIYINEESLNAPTLEVLDLPHNKADHYMLVLDISPIKTSKPLPRHPDYLLESPHYIEQLCDTIREFLILQSKWADIYQETPISREHLDLITKLQNEQTLYYEMKDLEGTASLKKSFDDLSTVMRKAKLDNFFKQIRNEPPDTEPKHIAEMMDNIIRELDNPQHSPHDTPTPISILEALLQEIMQFSYRYRKKQKATNPIEIIRLQQKHINRLRMKGQTADNNPDVAAAQERIKEETHRIRTAQTARSAIRANLNEEKPSKSFLGRGKNNGAKSRITKITTQDKTLIGQDAENHMVNLFKNILGKKSAINEDMSVDDFLGEAAEHTPKLDLNHQSLLDEEISIDELDNVVDKAHTDSAPGMSGISYQLIKHIWPLTRKLFHKATLQIMGSEDTPPLQELPQTWCQRRIILIGKPNKPQDDEGAYRPISLLEIPYKIVAGVMAARLKQTTSQLIGPSQKGYIPGRCAMDVTRSVVDTRNIAIQTSTPLAIVGLDFSKAFDTISHTGLLKILNFLKFPDRFITRIMLLLSNAKITLDINGRRHAAFPLEDGTGQGDPISSYLFDIVVEIFLNRIIHQNSQILFSLHGNKHLPEAYADDIHILAKGDDPESISNIVRTAERFQELTGLALSKSKTEYLSILATNDTTLRAIRLGLKAVDSIKFVGAHTASRPGPEEDNKNFENAFEKIRRVERSWGWRRPSPLGAVTIIRSLMASTMTHLLANFTLSKERSIDFEQITRTFVWASTHPQVRKARLSQPIERGGLNLVDINFFTTALRTRWYRTLTRKAQGEPVTESWIFSLNTWLEEYGIDALAIPDLGYKDINRLGSRLNRRKCLFWGENFIRYAETIKIYEQKTENPMALPIFGGLVQHHATRSKNSVRLTIFKKELVNAIIFKKFRIIGDLFHPHQIPGRIDTNLPISPGQAFPNTNNELDSKTLKQVRSSYEAIKELVFGVLTILPHLGRNVSKVSSVKTNNFAQEGHELQQMCLKHKKGSSFVYKELIKAKAKRCKFETPPAYRSSKSEQGHTMTETQWQTNMGKLMKIHCSPRTRWQNLQIFLRTVWTPMKQYLSTDHIDYGICPGCPDHWPANTLHLLFECSGLATNVWNFTRDIMETAMGKPFNLSKFQALYFQNITSLTDMTVIACAKRAILRVTHEVSNSPVHPKVGLACLRKEIINTARTNIKANRDTISWTAIEEAVKEKWSELASNRHFIVP